MGKNENKTKNKTKKHHAMVAKNDLPLSNTFSTEDYHSNDGMLVSVWGPSMWHCIHTMSFNYPVKPTYEDKVNYYHFLINLRNVLPCGKCRENLCANLKKLPLKWSDMENRDNFSKYVYNLHEAVNKMLGKKSGLTYDVVRERYENFRARCSVAMERTRKNRGQKKEKGCNEPLVGEKSKCILRIVPQARKCDSFSIEKECIKRRIEKTDQQ
jgi:hypothetical protein